MKRRIALVTGAASGIGAATVDRLAADGFHVIAFDRAAAAARDGVSALIGDVTRQADVDAAIGAAREAGGLHVVVNAAGAVAADDPDSIEDATWERLLAVNLTGTMRVCRAAIPLLRAAGGGAIVNVASVAAFNSTPGSASYAPSKAGVVAFTRNIAYAHGVDGIRANCLCPGWTATAMPTPNCARPPPSPAKVSSTRRRRWRRGWHCGALRARRRWRPASASWPATTPRSSPARCLSPTAAGVSRRRRTASESSSFC